MLVKEKKIHQTILRVKKYEKTDLRFKRLIYLQHNGKCVCHHFNGPERVHDIFELVLSENPVWHKPEIQRQDVWCQSCEYQTHMRECLRLLRRTWVLDGIYEAWLE